MTWQVIGYRAPDVWWWDWHDGWDQRKLHDAIAAGQVIQAIRLTPDRTEQVVIQPRKVQPHG